MQTINTERLILKTILESDAEDYFEFARETNVGIHAGWQPFESIEETLAIMHEIFINKPGIFGIRLKETGKLIGSIGLITDKKRENERARMLGYGIGEEFWGKGYTTEAARAVVRYGFDELRLDIISAYCYPYNERSKRVLLKCDFIFEGRLKLCEERYDGAILDNDCYSIVKDTYC